MLHGRYYVSCEDVRAVAPPVLRHRIITNFNAEAEGIKPDDIVRRLIDLIPRDPERASRCRRDADGELGRTTTGPAQLICRARSVSEGCPRLRLRALQINCDLDH